MPESCSCGLCLAALANLTCLAMAVVLFTWLTNHEYLDFLEKSNSSKAAAFRDSPKSTHKAIVTSYGIEYTGTCDGRHGWASQKDVNTCPEWQGNKPECKNMSNTEIPQLPLSIGQVARRLHSCHDEYLPWAQVSYHGQQAGAAMQLTRCAFPYGTPKNSKGMTWEAAQALMETLGIRADDAAVTMSHPELPIWVFDAGTNCVVGMSPLQDFVAYEQSKAWGSLPGLIATFVMMIMSWAAFAWNLKGIIHMITGTGPYAQDAYSGVE